jgi:hypothetical protein
MGWFDGLFSRKTPPPEGRVERPLSASDLLPLDHVIEVTEIARDGMEFVPRLELAALLTLQSGDTSLKHNQVELAFRGCRIQVILTANSVEGRPGWLRWQLGLYGRDPRAIPDDVAGELADWIFAGEKIAMDTSGMPERAGGPLPGKGIRIYFQDRPHGA